VKRLLRLLLFVLAFAAAAAFCRRQTDGFTIASVTSDLPYNPHWESSPLTNRSILDQPFSYLGKGAQAYVFASEDGNYVLKLFRHDHMRPRIWSFFLDRPGDRRRQAKLQESFSSYKIAADSFREESGLVFLHLNKTNNLRKKLRIIDKIGVLHELDADGMEFLVQKKASLLYPTLEQWMASGKLEESKALLASLVLLLKSRQAKGIGDKDPNLETNFGVLGGKAVQIDIGRFRREESPDARGELLRTADPLHRRLAERYPELDIYLMEKIHET